jgi:hypothetical protein
MHGDDEAASPGCRFSLRDVGANTTPSAHESAIVLAVFLGVRTDADEQESALLQAQA